MCKKTSIHNINGDKKTNSFYKGIYIIANCLNNLFPYNNIDKNLKIYDFNTVKLEEHWRELAVKCSPSRKLSDLFWADLPWGEIKQELNEINIFDTGCGNGNYGVKLLDYSKKNINSYTGIDIYENENWEKLCQEYLNFKFYKFNGKSILEYIPENTNFIMTQSAIEHFEEDLTFFKEIKKYIVSCKKSVIQVHLLPARACLKLYLWHGIRQYTPRTLSKISRIFNDCSYSILFNLGGNTCNNLHYNLITKPKLKRKLMNKEKIKPLENISSSQYDKNLFNAIEKDMQLKQKNPTFYALIIHSNWKNKLFE